MVLFLANQLTGYIQTHTHTHIYTHIQFFDITHSTECIPPYRTASLSCTRALSLSLSLPLSLSLSFSLSLSLYIYIYNFLVYHILLNAFHPVQLPSSVYIYFFFAFCLMVGKFKARSMTYLSQYFLE